MTISVGHSVPKGSHLLVNLITYNGSRDTSKTLAHLQNVGFNGIEGSCQTSQPHSTAA